MMRDFALGRHHLRFLDLEPRLVYVRFHGDLSLDEARGLVQLIGRELDGRSSRFLVHAARLGAIHPDSRRELSTSGPQPRACTEPLLDVVLVGASLLHKVVLAQIVSLASLGSDIGGQTRFFDVLEDALRWLELPASLQLE